MTDFKIPSPADLTKLYINGEFVKANSDEVYTVTNPKDGSVVSEKIPVANAKDVDDAVDAAEAAFYGPWSKFTNAQRGQAMLKLADLLEEHLEDILKLDSLTSGNPVSLIPTREKSLIINGLRHLAGWSDKHAGQYMPDDDGFVKLVRYEPLGVCAAVLPFNAPIATIFYKAAPALATGNTIILKPSEKTPLGSLAIAPLFEMAGIPKGVVQVLTGAGSTGALLASHMRIRKISFTGSLAVGKRIQIAAAQSNLKRVTLELGGKSPAVVFEDANLENALTWTVNAIMARSGQVCVASSRVYVQRTIFEKFIHEYAKRMKASAQKMGDPSDPENAFGPVIDKMAFDRIKGMVDRAKTEARLVTGGGVLGQTGYFIEPTVFAEPNPDAQILHDEVFGPVSVIIPFDTEEEVIKRANDTEYGLMSGVFTQDITRALRVSGKIDSGVVGINCISTMSAVAPFGGKKQSGLGREFGSDVLRAYTEPKTVLINMNSP